MSEWKLSASPSSTGEEDDTRSKPASVRVGALEYFTEFLDSLGVAFPKRSDCFTQSSIVPGNANFRPQLIYAIQKYCFRDTALQRWVPLAGVKDDLLQERKFQHILSNSRLIKQMYSQLYERLKPLYTIYRAAIRVQSAQFTLTFPDRENPIRYPPDNSLLGTIINSETLR